MEQQLDNKVRRELIRHKLIHQEPLETMVATLTRIEQLEEECYMLKVMCALLAWAVIISIPIAYGAYCDQLVTAILFALGSGYFAYKSVARLDSEHETLKREYQHLRSQV